MVVFWVGEEGVVDEGDFGEELGAEWGDVCEEGEAVVPDN